jgi:acyl-CoA thioester hydrolase
VAPYVAHVPVRWTDQDVYRHVNHARVVTLLEEARIALVAHAEAEHGVTTFLDGLLVVGLHVDYRRPVTWRPGGVRVAMEVEELRAASYRITYALHDGPDAADPVAVEAWTRMAPYDLAGAHPRRLTAPERAFLARWCA